MFQLRKTYAPEKYVSPFSAFDNLTKELDTLNRDFDTTFGFGTTTFPPYDEWTEEVLNDSIVETHTFFKFAIAGLCKDAIKVSFDDETNTLKVSYNKDDEWKATKNEPIKDKKYKHRGIAKRAFEFVRTLGDTNVKFEILKASTAIESGCLIIELREIKKPSSDKYITIE